MKFAVALALVGAAVASANPFAPVKTTRNAKAAHMGRLMSKAKATPNSQLRRLDGEEYQVDLSTYSLKYEKCQFVKAYDDELADDEESDTVLATKRFVIFRLCPNNSCSTCSYGYGEYLIELDEYLESTVQYQQELQEEMCNACNECGNNQDAEDGGRRLQNANVDCDSCYDECQKIENMEENGYIDATEFLQCQMIYDPEDDAKAALYAGPICANDGAKIKIGVFTDENCYFVDASKSVDDYLVDGDGYQMKLSHALLKTVYSEEACVSCLVPEEVDENADDNNNNNNNNQDEQEPEVLEMCQQLYEQSAKCEGVHGFDEANSGMVQGGNQDNQETVVCDYISSIKAGSYDEYGEIVINGASASRNGGSQTSGGQKFALTFFILGTVGLAFYAAMLHSKLTKGGAAGLSDQGGAMA